MRQTIFIIAMLGLIEATQAQQIQLPIQDPAPVIQAFSDAYIHAGKPRIMIYINRDLVHPDREAVETASVRKSTQTIGDQPTPANSYNYQVGNNTNQNSNQETGLGGERLDVRSTVQYVEHKSDKGVSGLSDYDDRKLSEMISDNLMQAGVKLIDQQVATDLQKEYVGSRFLADNQLAPGSDRDAVKNSADIVIEVLFREQTCVVPTPAGDQEESTYDVVMTAIDVREPGLILGRSSTTTTFGLRGGTRASIACKKMQIAQLDPSDVLDQVTLNLMKTFNFQ